MRQQAGEETEGTEGTEGEMGGGSRLYLQTPSQVERGGMEEDKRRAACACQGKQETFLLS